MRFLNYCISLLLLVISTSSCSNRKNYNWHFTIPNEYQGFLVIGFNCPKGNDVQKSDYSLRVRYSSKGIACTSMKFLDLFPNIGTDSFTDTDGKTIPFLINGKDKNPAPSRAICGGETASRIIGGKELFYYLHWVGDPVRYYEFRNTDQYLIEENRFFGNVSNIFTKAMNANPELDTPTNTGSIQGKDGTEHANQSTHDARE